MINGTKKFSYKTPRMRDHIGRLIVPDPPRRVLSYLIRLAVCYITQVWPALVIIATLVIGGVVAYRIWKKHDSNW